MITHRSPYIYEKIKSKNLVKVPRLLLVDTIVGNVHLYLQQEEEVRRRNAPVEDTTD